MRSKAAWRATGAGVGVALALASCGVPRQGPGPAPPARPDVILVSLDTCRADAAMDSFAALARESVAFDRAYAPIPFTLPSHMSLMTGLYPETHGVTEPGSRLPPTIATLAEILRAAGYRTDGIHSTPWLSPSFGFDRGFERYDQVPDHLTYAERITDRALAALDGGSDARPLFLFLHYMDAHSDPAYFEGNLLPYYVPQPCRADLDAELSAVPFCDAAGRCATDFLLAADNERPTLAPRLARLAHALYERGLVDLDLQIERLLEGIRRRGLWQRSVVILLADHGEEFREHGLFLHSQPYEESVRVPLYLKLPGGQGAGRRVDSLVGLIDVLPTLVDLLRLPGPKFLQGASLLPLARGEDLMAPPRELLLMDKYDPTRHGLVTQGFKLILRESRYEAELYDLTSDPGESHDLARSLPEALGPLIDRMHAMLRAQRGTRLALGAGRPDPAARGLDAEAIQRLESLGYLH